MTAESLRAPSEGMPDLVERDLFFECWNRAVGSSSNGSRSPTESWLRGFGSQTKWLTGDAWTWWIKQFRPPEDIDGHEALNFLALTIGILEDRSPRGQAVRYAGEIFRYLEATTD